MDIIMCVVSIILALWVLAVLCISFYLTRPVLKKDQKISRMALKLGFRKDNI